jgi:hypothetical protein
MMADTAFNADSMLAQAQSLTCSPFGHATVVAGRYAPMIFATGVLEPASNCYRASGRY